MRAIRRYTAWSAEKSGGHTHSLDGALMGDVRDLVYIDLVEINVFVFFVEGGDLGGDDSAWA